MNNKKTILVPTDSLDDKAKNQLLHHFKGAVGALAKDACNHSNGDKALNNTNMIISDEQKAIIFVTSPSQHGRILNFFKEKYPQLDTGTMQSLPDFMTQKETTKTIDIQQDIPLTAVKPQLVAHA